MTQDLDIRLEGESIEIIDGELVTTFDTPNDGFSAQFIVDKASNPKLYKQISPYQGTQAEIYLEGELKLTGTLTKPSRQKNNSGNIANIAGFSNTFNFVDSALRPPYQLENYTIHELMIVTGRQTNTNTVHPPQFDTPLALSKFDRATVTPGLTGYQFCAPYAAQRSQVISSTIEGDLLLHQADTTQPPVGTIDESKTLIQTEFSGSWDLRKRFKTFTVISQTPLGPGEATATDDNISLMRHKLLTANNQLKGALLETAEYAKNILLIDELTQDVPVIGWHGPGGKLWEAGKILTLKSETLFVPDGFDYFIRAVRFMFRPNAKRAILSLIPKEVYTGEPIVEPWF